MYFYLISVGIFAVVFITLLTFEWPLLQKRGAISPWKNFTWFRCILASLLPIVRELLLIILILLLFVTKESNNV